MSLGHKNPKKMLNRNGTDLLYLFVLAINDLVSEYPG